MLGAAALNRFGDVLLGLVDRRLARFGIEPLEEIGGVVPRLALHLLQQQLLGFVGGEAGDALELTLLRRDELLVLGRRRRRRFLPLADGAVARVQLLLEPLDGALPLADHRFAPRQRLLERRRLLPLLTRLLLGVHQDLVRLLFGFEQRFFLVRLGVALRVLDDPERLLFGAADGFGSDPFPVRHPPAEYSGAKRHRNGRVDEVFDILHHA